MDRKVFMDAVKGKSLRGAYLLQGTEENVKTAAVTAVRRAILPEGLEQLNETVLVNPQASAIIAACETIPFMADQRLVIVRECGALAHGEADDRLLDWLQAVPSSAVLLFIQSGKADARKKLYKHLSSQDRVVSFNTLSDAELNDWVCRYLQKAERSCSPALASRIIFVVGKDTMLLRTELDKLIAFTEGRGTVTEQDIAAVITPSAEYSVFKMIDCVVTHQQQKAFTMMTSLLTGGEQRIGILALLLRQYRLLQHLKIMQYEKLPPAEIQSALGVPPFAMENYLRQARSLSGGQVKRAVQLLIDTEYRIKSGQLNENGALEWCMLQLMQS